MKKAEHVTGIEQWISKKGKMIRRKETRKEGKIYRSVTSSFSHFREGLSLSMKVQLLIYVGLQTIRSDVVFLEMYNLYLYVSDHNIISIGII